MYIRIKKSTVILFSVLAVLLILGLCAAIITLDCLREQDRSATEDGLAAGWRLSVAELAQALSELETDLQKGLYSSTEYQNVSNLRVTVVGHRVVSQSGGGIHFGDGAQAVAGRGIDR